MRTAGTTFVGPFASVAFGDYLTGANHVLPTGGRAHSFSGLSTAHYLRSYTIQEISAAGAGALASDVEVARRRRRPAGARGRGGRQEVLVTPFPAPDYASLRHYDPGRRPVPVDLSDNTNLWGPHPAALERMRAATPDDLRCYPEVYANTLRSAAADRFGVDVACVTTGAGSDDILDSAFRAAAAPGAVVAYADAHVLHGGRLRAHERDGAPRGRPGPTPCAIPGALLQDDPAVVYVCRPNNPTGGSAPADWVASLLDARPADGPLVIIDEAYADFAGETLIDLATSEPKVLVARTCSKAYGLAGLRCGFAIGRPETVLEVEKSRGPYKVSRLTAEVVVAAMRDEQGWVDGPGGRVRREPDAPSGRARCARPRAPPLARQLHPLSRAFGLGRGRRGSAPRRRRPGEAVHADSGDRGGPSRDGGAVAAPRHVPRSPGSPPRGAEGGGTR